MCPYVVRVKLLIYVWKVKKIIYSFVGHNVWHSLCWFVWVPVGHSLCLFWRETHTNGLSARLEVDEGRKVRERPEEGSQQKVRGEDNQEMKAGQSREKNWIQKDDC